jgi:PKD repeat protein
LSFDPDGTIVAWDWDFGDGGSSTVADPTYSYDDDGVYTITLTVWDDDSGTDVHTDTITVTNVGPTADFTYFPIEPSILDTVDFTDTSFDPDGTIVAWEWDFDDGDTSTIQNPSHQFTTSGQYSVSLKVWDDDDATDTIIIPIDITPPVEVEDVNQSLFDRGFPIRHTWDGDWGSAQSFDTDVTTLTSAQIYLRKFGTPEFNLTVEIREDHPEGTLIESMEFAIDDIPSTWTWLTVDFENFTVNPTTTYFIVLPPAPSSVSTSFGYEWGYTFGDVYSDGAFWFTRDGGDLWRDLPTRYDFTFITMGYVVN